MIIWNTGKQWQWTYIICWWIDSASLASLTRETGPKVIRGDPTSAAKVAHVPQTPTSAPAADVSDSSLKFTHVLHNLSPAGNHPKRSPSSLTRFDYIFYKTKRHILNFMVAELYEQAIKYEKGSFVTSTGALATLSGAKTGRSPKDKRVVKDETTASELWWGK